MVSLYHFNKKDSTINFTFDFDTFFEMFLEGHVMNGHWCKYNAVWFKFCQENPVRTIILTYESLLSNFDVEARKIGTFLDIKVDDKLVEEVKRETNVEKMKQSTVCGGQEDFVRKGISGDWKNHFSQSQTDQFDKWIEHNKKEFPKELFDLIGE